MERNDDRVKTVRKDAGDGINNNSYLDRSKVRILLCDNDAKSSKEVFNLLCKCSYQGCTIYAAGDAWDSLRIECSMPLHIYIHHCIDSINYSCDVFALTVFTHCLAVTSVRTPRQVIDALNAEGPDIDIILAEVDLPVSKGLKLLKYIMRDAELQRIPIIMMSAQDEVSVVVKCLKHGAADYLVKPLRTNELLNLWTHMWRRRHMLGLSEKKIMNYDFDLVASDPSDANTNSTTLFSDDTEEKSRRSSILENSISNYREDETNDAAFIEPALNSSSEHHPCVLRPSDQTVQFSSFSKRSELKIGESSAFFTYVKSSITPRICQRMGSIDENDSHVEQWTKEQETVIWSKPGITDAQRYTASEALENCHIGNAFLGSDTSHDTSYAERLCLPVPSEFHQVRNSKEEQPARVPTHPRNEVQFSVPGLSTLPSLPYYVPGMMNQVMMPSSSQLFQASQHDVQKHAASTILPQYNSLPQCSNHVPMMTSFPYYPIQVCMQTGQMPASQLWPANGISCSAEVKTDRIGRREAALIKFRQKRKDRCFDKKIRYMNRKRLAERRPRVRGQFVRQMNGVDVDLNGQPINGGDSDVDNEEEEEEELVSR